jgi:hypothetical protein
MLTWLRNLFGGGTFVEDMQVSTPPEAIAALFHRGAIARIPAGSAADVWACYIDVVKSWGDNGLYRGSVDQIRQIVSSNLTQLVSEPDFITLKLQTIKRDSATAAQVSAILRGRGMVGIRIWKCEDGQLCVCGNPSFQGNPSLLITAADVAKGTEPAACPRCRKPTQVERASGLLEGHVCASCGWAAIWCFGCRQAPMKATRQQWIDLGSRERTTTTELKCESCGKRKKADGVEARWLQDHRAVGDE